MTEIIKSCISVLLIITSVTTVFSDETIEVNLEQGLLSGRVDETFFKEQIFYSFVGIPYAEPPIGELRFMPPKPHKGWSGIFEAHENKPMCLQYNSRMRMGEEFGKSGSEDCLYLNVFTSSLEGSAPVVVFDYNDNFRTGFNGTATYAPDFFIEEGVIVVTINHRLGMFGYLTTEDDVIPANAGLKDFILGLKWVKENIEKFGGDPNRVTLMGNRGGAAAINILLYSDKAKGLFAGIILQSGTIMEAIYLYDNARNTAFKVGEALNVTAYNSKTLLDNLQNINAEKILKTESDVVDIQGFQNTQMSIYPFAPIVERDNPEAVITELPENAKIVNDVPVLIGFNSREGLDLVSHFLFEPRLMKDLTQLFVHFPVRSGFRFDTESSLYDNAVKEINNYYFDLGYLSYNNILEYTGYVGDILQNYALDFTAEKLANDLLSPVYYYMFDFRGLLNENSEFMSKKSRISMQHRGATVGDELCYLHLCNRIRRNYVQLSKLPSEQNEIKVLKKMVRLWTNFAKTGNPTPTTEDDVLKNITWQPINKESDDLNYLHITKQLKMNVNPLGDRRKFWDEFLDKYSKLAIDGVVSDKARDEL